MPGISVSRIPIPFNGGGGFNAAAYWATLISATVEIGTPSNIVLTFPSEGTSTATDLTCTVNGVARTINSASWTGGVWTAILASAVVFGDVVIITFVPSGGTVTVTNNILSWSIAGGITAPVAGYQAINVASYNASKVNIVNPGNYDLIKVNAADPSWDAVNGWVGNGQTSGSILDTQLTGNYGWSVVIFGSFTPQTSAYRIFGTNDYWAFYNRNIYEAAQYEFYRGAGGTQVAAAGESAYCLAACNRLFYKDGSLVGTSGDSTTGDLSKSYHLLGVNGSAAAGGTYKVYACAIYNYELTIEQLAAIITAFLNP